MLVYCDREALPTRGDIAPRGTAEVGIKPEYLESKKVLPVTRPEC